MSINKAVKEIKFELDEIENLFDLYTGELFLIIAKRIDKNIPWVEKKGTGKLFFPLSSV